MGSKEYYVQIQGEGKMEDNQRLYTLPTYDENGNEKTVTFSSQKRENDKKLKENAFYVFTLNKRTKRKQIYQTQKLNLMKKYNKQIYLQNERKIRCKIKDNYQNKKGVALI